MSMFKKIIDVASDSDTQTPFIHRKWMKKEWWQLRPLGESCCQINNTYTDVRCVN